MTTINPLLEIIERVKGLILEEESKIDKKDWSGVIHYLCSEKYPILLNSGSQILTNEGAEDQIQAHTHTLLQGLIATLQEQQFTIIVTLLLAIQSENLPSQCTFAFIAQTKSLFSKLNIEQLQAVHKKGISYIISSLLCNG